MVPGLDKGRWTRPNDKMAVYIELASPDAWGVRVTLMPDSAHVEAIEGEKCSRYQAPNRLSTYVHPPSWWERLRGITFEGKLLAEVERKRAVAASENATRDTATPTRPYPPGGPTPDKQ